METWYHLSILCYVNITIRFTCVGVAEQVDEKDWINNGANGGTGECTNENWMSSETRSLVI